MSVLELSSINNRNYNREITIDIKTERYYKSSIALHLPVKPREDINGFELLLGKKHYLFAGNETPFNNNSSARIAVDKYCTNKLLEMAEIPVPKAISMHIDEFQQGTFEKKITSLKFPLVIKPLTGSLGVDVLCNVQSLDELKIYLTKHFSLYDHLIIEEFHKKLKSYRVLVFKRKIIGVVLCHPARVIGDGKHNIKKLIKLLNIKREETGDPGLGPVVIDEECHIKLRELGIGLNYIPAAEEYVGLGYTSNGTRGGTFESLGKQICKENRQLMIRVTDVLNLNLTGIDVECEDINLPLTGTNGVILEVNHRPDLRIHELPMNGKPLLVSKKIMRSFISRHPFSYLYVLYSNRPTSIYIRSFIVAILIGIFFLSFISILWHQS